MHGALPTGANDTRAFIESLPDMTALRKQESAAQEEEREADQAKEQERIEDLKRCTQNGIGISGEEACDLGDALGIAVHPRTKGSMRKRVERIWPTRANLIGKGNLSDAVRRYWKDIQEATKLDQ